MLKLSKVKSDQVVERVKLVGVSICEVVKDDTGIRSIRLADCEGAVMEIRGDDTYSNRLSVYAKEPPAEVKRYRLSGSLLGLTDVCEDFEKEADANQRLEKYRSELERDDVDLTIAEVSVIVE